MDKGELETLVKSEVEWRQWLVEKVTKLETTQVDTIRIVSGLKVKSGVWGLIGGSLPVLIAVGIWILKGG